MARFTVEALVGIRQQIREQCARNEIGEPVRLASGVVHTLLDMAQLANLRTERPPAPRVPPETIWVQWSRVAGALVKEAPFAIIDGAVGKYRLVREDEP